MKEDKSTGSKRWLYTPTQRDNIARCDAFFGSLESRRRSPPWHLDNVISEEKRCICFHDVVESCECPERILRLVGSSVVSERRKAQSPTIIRLLWSALRTFFFSNPILVGKAESKSSHKQSIQVFW